MKTTNRNVRSQLAENDFRIPLVTIFGAGLTALISLSQLSNDQRFTGSGPTWLDPASVTALIVAGIMLGLFYANSTYVSILLRNRLEDGSLKPTDDLPAETHQPIADAHKQFIAGLIGMVVATGFFIAFLWT